MNARYRFCPDLPGDPLCQAVDPPATITGPNEVWWAPQDPSTAWDSPPVNIIRDLVATGELGQIYFVSMSRVNLGLHQSDVSVVWDLAPHDFSILCYWLNEVPSRVSAVSQDCILPGSADVAFVNLEFDSGTIAHVELSWLAPSKLRHTTIVGSRKMVVYDDTSIEPVRIFDSGVITPAPETFGEFRLSYRTGDIVSPHFHRSPNLGIQIYHLSFKTFFVLGEQPLSCHYLRHGVVQLRHAIAHVTNGLLKYEFWIFSLFDQPAKECAH